MSALTLHLRIAVGLLGLAIWVLPALPASATPVTYAVTDAPLNATLSSDVKFTFKFSGISNPSRSATLSDVPLSGDGEGAIIADWGTPRTAGIPGSGDWANQIAVNAGDASIHYSDLGGTQDNIGFGVQGVSLDIIVGISVESLTLSFEDDFLASLGDVDADSWLAIDTVDLGLDLELRVTLGGDLGNTSTTVNQSTSINVPWIMTLARRTDGGGENGSELLVPNLAGLVIQPDDFRIQLGSGKCPIPTCNGINVDVQDLSLALGATSVQAESAALIPLPEPSPLLLSVLASGFLHRLNRGRSRS